MGLLLGVALVSLSKKLFLTPNTLLRYTSTTPTSVSYLTLNRKMEVLAVVKACERTRNQSRPVCLWDARSAI